jgi:hypothetical protein
MAALPSGQHTEKMATFDTKIKSMRHLPGSAAKARLRPLTTMATSRWRERRASMSMMSTVRCSTVRLIGREPGAVSSPRRWPKRPAECLEYKCRRLLPRHYGRLPAASFRS